MTELLKRVAFVTVVFIAAVAGLLLTASVLDGWWS